MCNGEKSAGWPKSRNTKKSKYGQRIILTRHLESPVWENIEIWHLSHNSADRYYLIKNILTRSMNIRDIRTTIVREGPLLSTISSPSIYNKMIDKIRNERTRMEE